MTDITGREYIYGIAQDKNGAPYLFNIGEVVRCKDCRHSRVYQTDSKGTMHTNCVAFVMPRTVNDDDYCSWGERRKK